MKKTIFLFLLLGITASLMTMDQFYIEDSPEQSQGDQEVKNENVWPDFVYGSDDVPLDLGCFGNNDSSVNMSNGVSLSGKQEIDVRSVLPEKRGSAEPQNGYPAQVSLDSDPNNNNNNRSGAMPLQPFLCSCCGLSMTPYYDQALKTPPNGYSYLDDTSVEPEGAALPPEISKYIHQLCGKHGPLKEEAKHELSTLIRKRINQEVRFTELSPNGKFLFVALKGEKGDVHLVDVTGRRDLLADQKRKKDLGLAVEQEIDEAVFSPDSRLLFISFKGGACKLVDVENRSVVLKDIHIREGKKVRIGAFPIYGWRGSFRDKDNQETEHPTIRFSPNGKYLWLSFDTIARSLHLVTHSSALIDIEQKRVVCSWQGEGKAQFSPDSRMIGICYSADSGVQVMVNLFDIDNQKCKIHEEGRSRGCCTKFSPDSSRFAMEVPGSKTKVVSTESGQEQILEDVSVRDIQFSSDGRMSVVRYPENLKPEARVDGGADLLCNEQGIIYAAFTPDNTMVAIIVREEDALKTLIFKLISVKDNTVLFAEPIANNSQHNQCIKVTFSADSGSAWIDYLPDWQYPKKCHQGFLIDIAHKKMSRYDCIENAVFSSDGTKCIIEFTASSLVYVNLKSQHNGGKFLMVDLKSHNIIMHEPGVEELKFSSDGKRAMMLLLPSFLLQVIDLQTLCGLDDLTVCQALYLQGRASKRYMLKKHGEAVLNSFNPQSQKVPEAAYKVLPKQEWKALEKEAKKKAKKERGNKELTEQEWKVLRKEATKIAWEKTAPEKTEKEPLPPVKKGKMEKE